MHLEQSLRQRISFLEGRIKEADNVLKNKATHSRENVRAWRVLKNKFSEELPILQQKLKTYYPNNLTPQS